MGGKPRKANENLSYSFKFTHSEGTFRAWKKAAHSVVCPELAAGARAPSGSTHGPQGREAGPDLAREGVQSPLEFVKNKTYTEGRVCFSVPLGIILSRGGQNFQGYFPL